MYPKFPKFYVCKKELSPGEEYTEWPVYSVQKTEVGSYVYEFFIDGQWVTHPQEWYVKVE